MTKPKALKNAIDGGDVDGLRALLAEHPSLATTPISWGAVSSPCKTEPLHYLSDGPFNQLWNHGRQAAMAEVLIEAGAPVDGLPSSGETPLHGAASLGEAGVARVLIDHGANVESVANYPGIPDGTPLDFAVNFGMVEVIDLLVRRGAKVSSTRMAAGAGQLDRVEQDFASLRSNLEQLHDVMRCAAICDRTNVVGFLLRHGLDVNSPMDDQGSTMLHWAAWEAKPGMVKFLLHHGADPDVRDREYDLTPYGWANHRRKQLGSRWGHDDVLRLLAEHGRASAE